MPVLVSPPYGMTTRLLIGMVGPVGETWTSEFPKTPAMSNSSGVCAQLLSGTRHLVSSSDKMKGCMPLRIRISKKLRSNHSL